VDAPKVRREAMVVFSKKCNNVEITALKAVSL